MRQFFEAVAARFGFPPFLLHSSDTCPPRVLPCHGALGNVRREIGERWVQWGNEIEEAEGLGGENTGVSSRALMVLFCPIFSFAFFVSN